MGRPILKRLANLLVLPASIVIQFAFVQVCYARHAYHYEPPDPFDDDFQIVYVHKQVRHHAQQVRGRGQVVDAPLLQPPQDRPTRRTASVAKAKRQIRHHHYRFHHFHRRHVHTRLATKLPPKKFRRIARLSAR